MSEAGGRELGKGGYKQNGWLGWGGGGQLRTLPASTQGESIYPMKPLSPQLWCKKQFKGILAPNTAKAEESPGGTTHPLWFCQQRPQRRPNTTTTVSTFHGLDFLQNGSWTGEKWCTLRKGTHASKSQCKVTKYCACHTKRAQQAIQARTRPASPPSVELTWRAPKAHFPPKLELSLVTLVLTRLSCHFVLFPFQIFTVLFLSLLSFSWCSNSVHAKFLN